MANSRDRKMQEHQEKYFTDYGFAEAVYSPSTNAYTAKLVVTRDHPYPHGNGTNCRAFSENMQYYKDGFGLIPEEYNYLVYLIVPLPFILILCFFIQRTHLLPGVWNRRPGVPVPVNILQERSDRLYYTVAFGISMYFIIHKFRLLLDDSEEEEEEKSGFTRVMDDIVEMLKCAAIALHFYPVFAARATNTPFSGFLGCIFVSMLATFLILEDTPCSDEKNEGYTYKVLSVGPYSILLVGLVLMTPFRFLKNLITVPKHEPPLWDPDVPHYQEEHVRRLLKREEHHSLDVYPWYKRIAFKLFYEPTGFRYPLSVVIAVCMGLIVICAMGVHVDRFFVYKVMPHLNRIEKNGLDNTIIFLNYSFPQPLPEWGFRSAVLDPENKEKVRFCCDLFERTFRLFLYLTMLVTSASILSSMLNFRRHMHEIYRGCYENIPRAPEEPEEFMDASVNYISSQIVYAFWGFAAQFAVFGGCGFLLVASVAIMFKFEMWELLTKPLQNHGAFIAYYFLFPFLMALLTRFAFLLKDEHGTRVISINNRRCFFNYQYFMIYMNLPVGFIAAVMRIIKAIIIGIWLLPRLDMSTLSRGFEDCDDGYSAYIGMLHFENVQNNPVLVVFLHYLWATRHFHGELEAFALDEEQVNTVRERRKRYNRARNRWHLAITLYNNPNLRLYRGWAMELVKSKGLMDEMEKLKGNRVLGTFEAVITGEKKLNAKSFVERQVDRTRRDE